MTSTRQNLPTQYIVYEQMSTTIYWSQNLQTSCKKEQGVPFAPVRKEYMETGHIVPWY
jgi:hypothetical protein